MSRDSKNKMPELQYIREDDPVYQHLKEENPPDLEGETIGFIIAFIGGEFAAGTAGTALIKAIATDLVIAGLTYGLSSLLAPSAPSFGSGSFEKSRTYGFDNVGTSYQPLGESIPIIYGTMKQGGQRVQSFTTLEGDTQFLHMLLLVGEGEVKDIRNIKINNQPVTNFDGVTIHKRFGTPDQEPIPELQDQVNQFSDNQAIVHDSFVTYTTQKEVDELVIGVNFNSGLFRTDKKGNLRSESVIFDVEWKENGTTVWDNSASFHVSAKSRAVVRRELKILFDLKDKWDIRIKRQNEESQDTQVTDFATASFFREIIYDTLSYPNLALIGLKIRASEQLSGVEPEISYVVDGRILDSNKFPDELLSEDTHSDNFYLCLWDLLALAKHRGGAGFDPARIHGENKRFLSDWISAKEFVDELVDNGLGTGDKHKRHRFNFVVDQDWRVNDLIAHFNTIMGGFILPVDDGLRPIIDKPNQQPQQVFSEGKNIIRDSINWQYISSDQKFNSVKTEILDQDEDFNSVEITIPRHNEFEGDQLFPQEEVSMAGVTRKAEAFRTGLRKLIEANREILVVTYESPINVVRIQPGDLVSVGSLIPDKDWGGANGMLNGVNIVESTVLDTGEGDVLHLDREITFDETGEYNIQVMLENDTLQEIRINDVMLGETTSSIIVEEGLANLEEQEGSKILRDSPYSIGKLNRESKLVRILAIRKSSENNLQLQGVVHYENKFAQMENFVFSPRRIEILTRDIPPKPVENLVAEEQLVEIKNQFQSNIHVFWTPPDQPNVGSFNIYWDDNVTDGIETWIFEGNTEENAFIIPDVSVGEAIAIRVQTVLQDGTLLPLKLSPEVQITPVGETSPPPDVQNFQARFVDFNIHLTWREVNVPDLDHYEIRRGESFSNSVLVNKVRTNKEIVESLPSGIHNFWIKAVDRSGNKSVNASKASITVNVGKPKNLTFDFNSDSVIFIWEEPNSSFPIDFYTIKRNGTDFESAEFIENTDTLSFTFPVDWDGTQTWRFRTQDIGGNTSQVENIDVIIEPAKITSITDRVISNTVLLQWTAEKGSLDISHYEIRSGTALETADLIGTSDTTFTTISESTRDTFTYWVVPIDMAGNEGVADNIIVELGFPPDFRLHGSNNQLFDNPSLLFDEGHSVMVNHSTEFEGNKFSVGTRFVLNSGILDGNPHELVRKGVSGTGWGLRINNNKFVFRLGTGTTYEGISGTGILASRKEYFLFGQLNETTAELWQMHRNIEQPEKLGEITLSGTYVDTTHDLFIGASQGTSNFFEGIIDDTQFHTKIFNAEEIQDLFRQQINRKSKTLKGFWPSDEPFGRRLIDESSFKHHGKIEGARWNAFHDEKQNTILTDKLSNVPIKGILGPVADDISWGEHFDSNQWNTPQEQIDAGFPIYHQPASGIAIYDEVFDVGTVIPTSNLQVTLTEEVISGNPKRKIELGYRKTETGTWIMEESTKLTANNFRFVRTRVTISGTISGTRDDLLRINSIRTIAGAQTVTDNFLIFADETDINSGTRVDLVSDFVDVINITATPKTSDDLRAVVDFVDEPFPTHFNLFVYDSAGNRASNDVSISVNGFLA